MRQLGALLYDVDRLIPVEALAEATSSTLEVTHQGLERLAVHLEPVGLRLHRLGNTVKIVRDVDAVSTDVLRRTWRRHLARRGLDTGQARLLHRVYTGQHGKTLSNNDQVTAAELVNARILDRTSAGGATLTDDVRYSLMVKP